MLNAIFRGFKEAFLYTMVTYKACVFRCGIDKDTQVYGSNVEDCLEQFGHVIVDRY